VQYTTDLNQHIRKAKPRKRVSLMPTRDEAKRSIAIHEDATRTLPRVAEGMEDDFTITRGLALGKSGAKRQSITAQPARRRRVSAILADRLAVTGEEQQAEQMAKSSSVLKKEARRRTIFIPDDTTVMTIHPGVAPTARAPRDDTVRGFRRQLSPDMGLDLVTLSEGPESPYPVLKQNKPAMDREKKAPRKSLAMPPKRAPLGVSKKHTQNVTFAQDIAGAPTGKENLASPGTRIRRPAKPLDDMAKTRLSMAGLRDATPEKSRIDPRMKASLAHVVAASSPGKRKGTDSILDYSPAPTRVKTSKAASKAEAIVTKTLGQTTVRFASVEDAPESPVAKPKPRVKVHVPLAASKVEKPAPQYQVLSEDLAHPSLYEDHWLSHQEISLSQLLNDVFTPQHTFKESVSHKDMRKQFLDLYHDPAIPMLHKRLQASLLYGALSIPKDLLAKAGRVKDDVGLKRKFLDLWVESYDMDALKAALEVVVGREVPQARLSAATKTASQISHGRSGSASSLEVNTSRLSTGSTTSDAGERKARSERKAIDRFIEAFLIKHEDAVRPKGTIGSIARSTDQKGDDFGSPAWSWRRTVLKSLMLILLLDKAKTNGLVEGCLFQSTSTQKSSATMLTALSGMLLPSLGDILRPLNHLNYTVTAAQYPLQEYTYDITNLATDLRDGVKLARLVELLLFDKHYAFSATTGAQNMADNTITLSLPTGDMLTSTWTRDPAAEWILSQHLKFPCLGRPQKLFNVQIALSALSTLGGAAAKAAEGISAEDIVDGHRERTLSLLWAVVGYCGLGTLVDWRELKREVRHFRFLAQQQKNQSSDGDITDGLTLVEPKDAGEVEEKTPSLQRCTKLLLAWAQSIAALKGLTVTNLTTSFKGPAVLGAVVDAYLPYVPAASALPPSCSLATKLKAIGCSTAFTDLYSANGGTSIPSKSFTVSTLTFLSSRLLPLSRTARACSIIQRTVRLYLAKKNLAKRVALARLAHHCAVVVRTRERVVGAAVLLQRAWKAVLNKRMKEVLQGVVGFQAKARGWAAREKVRGGGQVRDRRVIGGW
jgi:abnormal spindle-like microcephaly-associated protein